MLHKVLVVDDDKILQESVRQALEYHQFIVQTADNGKLAVEAIYREKYDLVVMDVNMPEMDGLQALEEIKKHDPSVIVIILTAFSNVNDAVRAVKEGAYNYLEKPISADNLVALVKRALKARSLVETSLFSAPILSLDVMKKVFGIISKLAQVNTPVLIRGESGTGKELVAKAIHYNGPRKDEKFVTINLAAIPENLIESELFGHEKGAFTGASERKIGKFQYADGGTLFLDEIGDITATMQVKLLRVLQEKCFTPVGSNRDIKVDVRIIAASHKPFEEMIKTNQFREDLFYRLNVLPVFLPPLRERFSDIPLLLEYYVKYFNTVHGLAIKGASAEAIEMLKSYDWPGNIREFRNVIEHAFIIESSDILNIPSLPDSIKKAVQNSSLSHAHSSTQDANDRDDLESMIDIASIRNSIFDENQEDIDKRPKLVLSFGDGGGAIDNLDFQFAKDMFEKEFIILALKENKGRINQTALKANIPKKTLLRKIEKYEINPKEYYL
jgi:DNA-binding NtrC family response regulator